MKYSKYQNYSRCRRINEVSSLESADQLENAMDSFLLKMDNYTPVHDGSDYSWEEKRAQSRVVVNLLFLASEMIRKAAEIGECTYNMTGAEISQIEKTAKDAWTLSYKYSGRKLI